MRASPSVESDIVKTLKKDDTLTVTGNAEGGWVPVTHGEDSGWVSADYINVSSSDSGI